MDDTHCIDHFMAGIAAIGDVVDGAKGAECQGLILCIFQHAFPVFAIAPLSPGIKAEFLLDNASLIGNDVDAA